MLTHMEPPLPDQTNRPPYGIFRKFWAVTLSNLTGFVLFLLGKFFSPLQSWFPEECVKLFLDNRLVAAPSNVTNRTKLPPCE